MNQEKANVPDQAQDIHGDPKSTQRIQTALGMEVADVITGFTGTATAYCVSLYETNSYCIEGADEGGNPTLQWFPETRVVVLPEELPEEEDDDAQNDAQNEPRPEPVFAEFEESTEVKTDLPAPSEEEIHDAIRSPKVVSTSPTLNAEAIEDGSRQVSGGGFGVFDNLGEPKKPLID